MSDSNNNKEETMGIRINPKIREILQAHADLRKISLSQFIRSVVCEYLHIEEWS